jgi:hypothetical protein
MELPSPSRTQKSLRSRSFMRRILTILGNLCHGSLVVIEAAVLIGRMRGVHKKVFDNSKHNPVSGVLILEQQKK